MTPIELRTIIDNLIKEHGKEEVIATIESILDFYRNDWTDSIIEWNPYENGGK